MKERPILFSGPMVRAILAGRKTQTRRVVKPQPVGADDAEAIEAIANGHLGWSSGIKVRFVVGDRLWVQETWMARWEGDSSVDDYPVFGVVYRADNKWKERACPSVEHSMWYGSWQPSIHMQRWASRIDLEITGVRVERLQDISEEDAVAEGIEVIEDGYYHPDNPAFTSYTRNFGILWDSINGKKHPWESNPWVWVLTFRRIGP